jgi:protocatechuate 3,4-dioxygenase beta subunit
MKLALLCLLASAPMLFGQSATASLEGRVVNAATGAAVRRATVTLRLARPVSNLPPSPDAMNAQQKVETDDEGRFAFRNLAPGGYLCIVERQGFLNPEMVPRGRPTPLLMVGEGQQLTGIVVRLTPQGVIAGKIMDRDGEPAQGAQVMALRWGYVTGRRQLVPTMMTSAIIANDLGEFRIPGLPPGNYVVAAGIPGMGRVTETAYTTTYYPGVTDASAAKPATVQAGAQTRGIDFKLAQVKSYTVRGRIVEAGAPGQRPPMLMLVRNGAVGMLAFTGQTMTFPGGRFEIAGVPPGSYRLVARRNTEQGPPSAGASIAVEVADRDLDGIEDNVAPGFAHPGAVRHDGAPSCPTARVMLSAEGGMWSNSSESSGASFVVKGVIPGTYLVEVQSGGPCYARSIRFDGREIAGQRLTIDAPGRLEITLAPADATIDGTVVDASGKPVADAAVTFVARDAGTPYNRFTMSNQRGVFSSFGLPAGAYDVYAFEAVDYQSAQSPDYVRQFAGRGAAVTVAAGGRSTVSLTAIPAAATGEPLLPPSIAIAKGSVEGRVVNAATGAPVASVKVSLSTRMRSRNRFAPDIGPPPEATADTDAQGRFSFPEIDPEIYYIGAEKQGFLSPSDMLLVGNGQKIVGRTVALDPQAVIAGRVQDEYGDPVTNADVALYRAEQVGGARRMYRVAAARTDDLGKFRLAGLTAGTYDVAVTRRQMQRRGVAGAPPASGAPEMGFGILWNNGVVVAPGAEVPLEMVMRRTRVFRVRGTVTDEQDRPVERQQAVGLSPRGIGGGLAVGNTTWLSGGAFDIASVPPGSYLLWTRPGEAGPAARMGFANVEVRDSNVDGVRVKMSPGREVRGRVVWDGDPLRFGTVGLEAVEGYTVFSQIGPTGSFTLTPVWPVPYAVNVSLPCPTCYVKSMRYAGRDLPEGYVTFEGDGEFEIQASAAGGMIVGTATPGLPVRLEGAGKVVNTKADSQGAFTFQGLKPGPYKVTAGAKSADARVQPNGRAEVAFK